MNKQLPILKVLMLLLLVAAGTLGTMAQGPAGLTDSGDHSVCVGTITQYGVNPTANTTYEWVITPLTGGDGVLTLGALPYNLMSIEWTTVGTARLELLETNGAGCSITVSIVVTVNELPIPVAIADEPCHGKMLTLTGAPDGMATYEWSGPNGFTSSEQSPTIPGIKKADEGVYTLIITNGNGCSASTTVDVIINELPIPVATANEPCEGGTLTLTGAPDDMTTYEWSGPEGFASSEQSPTISNVTIAAAGTYTLTITNGKGCSETTTVEVIVNPLPVSLATANEPCEGGTLTLTGAPDDMTTYAWIGPDGFTSALQNPSILTVTAAAAGTYTLTITNEEGCSASSTVEVVINPLPAPVATANEPCEGGTLTLTGSPDDMATYSWIGPDGFTSALQNPSIAAVTAAAAGTYTLTITNEDGCSASSTVEVVINPLPAPVATANEPCEGEALVLTGAPDGMTTYAWIGPNGFTSSEQSPTITAATALAAGTYTLTITNEDGCSASATVEVIINPIPNTSTIFHN